MAPKAAPPPEAPPPAEAEPEPEPEVGESKFVFPDGSKYGMRDTPPGERLRGHVLGHGCLAASSDHCA